VRVPFRAGELLTYDVSYSSCHRRHGHHAGAGQAPLYNSVAYYVVAEARPAPLLSKVYALLQSRCADGRIALLPQRAGVYSEEATAIDEGDDLQQPTRKAV
jgi:hypothetical protein